MEGVKEMDKVRKKKRVTNQHDIRWHLNVTVAISFSYANEIRFESWTLNGDGIWQSKQGCN